MRVKIPRWEIAVICSALLFPGTSLSAQEVGQEEKEVKEIRKRAAEVAEQALWKHFIQYYYEAYDIALRKARIRQLS